ncbi:hypothetical protein [Hymenobacter sp. APR13]|uniref:hypothetical protein n=1 Tax=Hymenobacter sp. APR13 TaxID=1356852 RepID=UPI0004E0ACDB|nr:hypothetical protein [Hymenobacter sp. APR13]AII54334.1 hypothetical protein N008_20395 [Hymenobacter sp. APR13]
MLTRRTAFLLFPALLLSCAAAAQTSAAPAGPQGTDVLSWTVWWLAGLVLLMAVVTGSSVVSAARRYGAEPATPVAAPAAAQAPAAAEASAARQVAADAPVAEEAVARIRPAALVEYASV